MVESYRDPWRVTGLVVVAFLLVAILQLWWQQREANGAGGPAQPTASPAQIAGEERSLLVAPVDPDLAGEREELRRQEMRRQIGVLSASGDVSRRRSAALRLQFLADDSAQPALLRALNDGDEVVALRCAKALLILWRTSHSPSVNRLIRRGLAAHGAGDYDGALEDFAMCLRLDPALPDVRRLRAEILLAKEDLSGALSECEAVLRLNGGHFRAYYVQAECYRDMREGQAALDSVNSALSIYATFREAYDLKQEILSLQAAGEL